VRATAVGLAALLVASRPAFLAVKLVGAAYLVYLGATTLVHGRTSDVGVAGRAAITRGRGFRQGFLSTITNPKPTLFFATYLPQFVNPHGNVGLQILALGAFHCVVGIVWLTTYAQLVGRLHAVLTRERVRRRLERATGGVLVALGLRVAFTDR
jgi:threonine/homoserine/homoserine lactone efflux protein